MAPQQYLVWYDEYADALFRHCFFRISNREDALDIVQETFMRTWQWVIDGKEIRHPKAFLYRIATNLIIDRSRKKRSLSLDLLHEQGFDPKSRDRQEATNAAIDFVRVFERLDSSMDAKYREVLLLRYMDGFKPKEIARMLGESENVISVRIHRAMKQAQQLLQAYET